MVLGSPKVFPKYCVKVLFKWCVDGPRKPKTIKTSIVDYFGYGVRFGRDGTVGYVPRGGSGILITAEGEKRPLFFC